MSYVKPENSRRKVDKAAEFYRDLPKLDLDGFIKAVPKAAEAIEIIQNFRSAHSRPLVAFRMTLRMRANKIDSGAITVQRLKRYDSIIRKLRSRETMKLTQMQDIGGCRAIVSNMRRLDDLSSIYHNQAITHTLNKSRDYVSDPKVDGYRSIHLMYSYKGRGPTSSWDKLRVEIQLRTRLQHAWATAVETVDAFTGDSLKFSNGNARWQRFFALMGSVHANSEKTNFIPGTPSTNSELYKEVFELNRELNVISTLQSYRVITRQLEQHYAGKQRWYLIELMPTEGMAHVRSFTIKQLPQAIESLADAETKFKDTGNQAVLVSADSLRELKKAYPNYFADTRNFILSLTEFLGT